MTITSPFLRELQWRGFIHQITNLEGLDAYLTAASTPRSFYIGYDATGDSLHVGNLKSIMLARIAQRHGLKPLMLMGGGTTKVGDPSGKTEARQMITDELIQQNIASIQTCFKAYLTFGNEPADAVLVNNAQWLDTLNYIDMLRDIGRHFSVNRMLTMDSVRLRLDRDQPLSFLEFNYMILQAYDFYWLSEHKDCLIQCGGSDQWGNIIMGADLVRRMTGKEAFGLTTPLVMKANGEKMGKTHTGAVWLNPDRLSTYEYWQFWRNCDDADVVRFLKIYTDLPQSAIEAFDGVTGEALNAAKILLANEATTLLHGPEATQLAQATVATLFGAGEDIHQIQVTGFDATGHPLTTAQLPIIVALTPSMLLVEVMKDLGLAASLSEGRRLIAGGGVRVMDAVVEDAATTLTASQTTDQGLIKVSVGKKRHGLVYFKGA